MNNIFNYLNEMSKACFNASDSAGWWSQYNQVVDHSGIDDKLKSFILKSVEASKYALFHSEVSEGLEGLRKDSMDDKLPHRLAEEVELADALIRIFDYAGKKEFDLSGAVIEKLEYNKTRVDHSLESRSATGGKEI